MDLLNGLIQANAPISQQDATGNYISGVNAGQIAAKQKMENENAKYQQDLTLRLQKTIQQSLKPDGSIDYDLLARNGAANGISPQTIDYMTKQLPTQWKSLADTAQAKMQLQMQSPTGFQQAQQNVNAPNQSWSNQPAKASQSSTQSSTKSPAVPVDTSDYGKLQTSLQEQRKKEDIATPWQESDAGDWMKSSTNPSVGADTKAETGYDQSTSDTMDVGKGTLSGDLMPAPEKGEGLTQDKNNTTPTKEEPTETTISSTGGLYDIGNKMGVRSIGGSANGLSGDNKNITGISNYTIPQNKYTDRKGNIKQYTNAELDRNPQLNIAKSAENYFRSRTGDNTTQINDLARNYLTTIRNNAITAEGVPFPPVYPVSGNLEAIDKYNEAYRDWENKNAQAIGKADKAVNDVKEAVAKGQFDLADKIVENQKTTIFLPGDKEYRAYDAKGRDGVASLIAVDPVANKLSSELKSLKPGDYTTLQLLIPQAARVMAMRLNPGSDVSMGSIAEAEATTNMKEAQNMGLSVGGAISAFADWLIGDKSRSFKDVAKGYLEGAIQNASVSGIASKVGALLDESAKSAENYKKANLIGYKNSGDESAPMAKDESNNPPLTNFPTSGWYNQPYDPNKRIGFTSSSGKKYEVENPGKDAFGNYKPYTIVHDSEGTKYNITPGSNPNSVNLTEQEEDTNSGSTLSSWTKKKANIGRSKKSFVPKRTSAGM